MAPGRGLPARAEEPLVRVDLLIKDGEPGCGFGLHGHCGTFLRFLGAGESQTELEVGTSHESPAVPGAPWSDPHRRGAGWRLCQEGPCQEPDNERVRHCYGSSIALCPGNGRCGDACRDQVGVWTVQPLQTTPSPEGPAGRVTGQRTWPPCGAPNLGTPWGQTQSHCTDALTWGLVHMRLPTLGPGPRGEQKAA